MVDLGFLQEDVPKFIPKLLSMPHDFEGFVGPGETVRFVLGIEAENFVPKEQQVFEVSWDGTWSANADELAKHLTVTERDAITD